MQQNGTEPTARHQEAGRQELIASLERRLQERTAQLQAAMKELENFTYSVSHDLRAPMRAVRGISEILVEDHTNNLPPETMRLLQLLQHEGMRMDQMIDGLLTLSRIGRQPVCLEPIDMSALAKSVFDNCAARAIDRQFQFELPQLIPGHGDLPLIRQAISNLTSNAIKYTRRCTVAEIQMGSRNEGKETVYWIKDNGVGFNPQYATRLFGIFQRLHSDTEFEGIGVGLAAVQRIIHRHGGRVWAESQLNQGATFYFTLVHATESSQSISAPSNLVS